MLGLSDPSRLKTLCKLAGLQDENLKKDTVVTREALKIIANALLMAQPLRTSFIELNSVAPIYKDLLKGFEQNLSTDTLFLYTRILFLATVKPSNYSAKLVLDYDFCDFVLKILRKLESDSFSAKLSGEYTFVMLITELLKVVFSLMVNFPKSLSLPNAVPFSHGDPSKFIIKKFESLFVPLLRLVNAEDVVPEQVFLCALPILVNFLEHFSADTIPSTMSLLPLSEKLVKGVLELTAKRKYCPDTESEYEKIISHVVLLKQLCREFPTIKDTVSQALLPSAADRLYPIGEGDSATARLAAILRVISFSAFKDAVSELFFTLCDENAETMVKRFGYGNVAGFLISKNISPEIAEATTPPKDGISQPTNPITGQYQTAEPLNTLEPMSEEEKLREAERLFVLFERIKTNPTIQIQNPVEAALHAGKLAELNVEDDSD